MIEQFIFKLSTLLILVLLLAFNSESDFITQQKKFERVRNAFKEKESLIKKSLSLQNILINECKVLIVVYKQEAILELYGAKVSESTFQKIETYKICSSSGELGPKRKQGDNQVPEGFYSVDRFNPSSNFYLSLGINYPNQSDKKKITSANAGGDIFIHGSCVTIGCMPMTDDKIKEIYLYAISAKQNGQTKIPVYIFPFKMTDENLKTYSITYKQKPELLNFWSNLKTGFDKFDSNKNELDYIVDKSGNYQFQ